MSLVEERLHALGLALPEVKDLPPSRPQLAAAVQLGNALFVSGHGPVKDGQFWPIGKLGRELSTEVGYEAARLCTLHAFARLKVEIGDLDRIKRVVRLLGLINSTPEFDQHPQVLNGASDLLIEVFGERGIHARSAVGVAALPRNFALEVEMILEIE